MKYLLAIYMNPDVWEGLTEQQREDIANGAGEFVEKLKASGELVATHALADPAASAVVRVRGDVPAVTDGPEAEAKEFLAGYYVVECESRERALQLAAMDPMAPHTGIEVRPIVFSAGPDEQ